MRLNSPALSPYLSLIVAAAFAALLGGSPTDASASGGLEVQGLCTPRETIYLACETPRARWISLCGSGDGQDRTLQYRFGRKDHVELQYPEKPEDGPKRLLHAHYFRSQVDRTEVRFESAGNDYTMFDYTEQGKQSAGVRVTTANGKEIEIACRAPIASRLSELSTLLPCDRDNALNGGECGK